MQSKASSGNAATSEVKYLKDYRPSDYLATALEMHFDFFETYVRVRTKIYFEKNPAAASSGSLFLNGVNLELEEVSLDGKRLKEGEDFELHKPQRQRAKGASNEGLTVFASRLKKAFTLETSVKQDPYHNTSLQGLYSSGNTLCTQNEPEGFRSITYSLDRPDVLSRYTVTLTADQKRFPTLLSNGNLVERRSLAKGRHLVKYHDPFLKPTYLFAVVAGDLDELKDQHFTASGRKIQLSVFTDPGKRHLARHAMNSLKKAMEWDEATFGLECDLDDYKIVAVASFNFGAMENKGLNIFNSRLVLADEKTTTDTRQRYIEAVIGHEYFHNWSGNRVTLRDWFQLTLKEGLTVFRDQEFTSELHSRLVKRIEDVSALRSHQFKEDASPLSHPPQPAQYQEISNFYTTTVYDKGAEVVRLYQLLMGKESFRTALKAYFKKFDGQAVTTQDFFNLMQEHCLKAKEKLPFNFSQFKKWYSVAGTPTVEVSPAYNSTTGNFSVTLKQRVESAYPNPADCVLLIPLAYRLATEGGEEKEGVLFLQQAEQYFDFGSFQQEPVFSCNRHFSSPIHLVHPLSLEKRTRQLSLETDPFCFWDQLQALWLGRFQTFSLTPESNEPAEQLIPATLLNRLGEKLQQETDYAFLAECFALPSPQTLINASSVIDLEKITRFREALAQELVAAHQALFWQKCHDLREKANPAKRALKNCLLGLLTLAAKSSNDRGARRTVATFLWEALETATNMTDELAALHLILKQVPEKRAAAAERFYHRWRSDSMVVCDWFLAMALIEDEETFERMNSLEKTPEYDPLEPNKIRSLWGGFTTYNLKKFHHPTGRGYALLQERCLFLDKKNPQIAARLLTSASLYPKLPSPQKELLKKMLLTLQEEAVSKDVLEITTKLLKAPKQ